MVVLSPWVLGAVDPVFEFALDAGVALLLVLWAAKAAVDGQLVWLYCPVTLCLAGLFLWGALQLVPLPEWLLSAVAPANARLLRELLPPRPEFAEVARTTTHPLSLYPTATRNELFRLLAVFAVFVCVRTQLSSTRALRRLALVAIVNGVLLALFGFAQATSAHGLIYWSYRLPGHSFGPFVNHADFACYVNLCIGLGVGLLLAAARTKRKDRNYRAATDDRDPGNDIFSIGTLLQTPQQLWLCTALAVMVAGVVASLSRGGVVALAGGAAVALALCMTWPPRIHRLEVVLLPAVLAAALVAWYGVGAVEQRFATVWSGEAADARIDIWAVLGRLLPDFGLLGSGYGTVNFVEPLARTENYSHATTEVSEIGHAHNDYLESLVEGGVLRLALTLALVWFLVRFGRRALERHGTRTPGLLAFGALIGVLAVAIHSFVDYVLFTPAVAVLATVVAAQMCSLARSVAHEWPDPAHSNAAALRLRGWGGAVAVVLFVPPAVLLFLHGRQLDLVDRYRVAASRALRAKPPDPEAAAAALDAAVHVAPDDANLRVEAGQVHLDARQFALQQYAARPGQQAPRFVAAVQAVADGTQPAGAFSAAGRSFARADVIRLPAEFERSLDQRHLLPALRQFVAARELCPLLSQPHLRLVAFAEHLETPDAPDAYWSRAERLAPTDPELWYYAGLYHFRAGVFPPAWEDWRRSLELCRPFADWRHLDEIVAAALPKLGPDGLMEQVLPDDPSLLMTVVRRTDPVAPAEGRLRPLIERAVVLSAARSGPLLPRESYARAVALRLLDRPDEALTAYKAALLSDSAPVDWEYEYAQLLFERGKLQEAQNALDLVLVRRPSFPGAKELREKVARERSLKE